MTRPLPLTLSLSALCIFALACESTPAAGSDEVSAVTQGLHRTHATARARVVAELFAPPAGVAGDADVVFVGSPFEGRVIALSRRTHQPVGELPAPEDGFILPFILHEIAPGRVAVLDAGGVPSPAPFVPVNPIIYEYAYSFSASAGLSAALARRIPFDSALIGFPEDFVHLRDGRYLLSDAVLGSIWIAEPDGSIRPGIVPKSFAPEDAIPELAFCPTMPEIQVNGVPFLFSGSTLPGIGPMAVRNGILYFSSSCAGGTFEVPLATLFDSRAPDARAADLRLLSPKPDDLAVEELLGFAFAPRGCGSDDHLYAADALQQRIIRIDVHTGERQVVAYDPTLLDFPSSTAFLPERFGKCSLGVVSNQQERLTFTNDAITQDDPMLPFLVTKLFLDPYRGAFYRR